MQGAGAGDLNGHGGCLYAVPGRPSHLLQRLMQRRRAMITRLDLKTMADTQTHTQTHRHTHTHTHTHIEHTNIRGH